MKNILIIEDDAVVATAYKKKFADAGYKVEWAPDGLEGIKMVTSVKPDVVLLDLLMPRLDGLEVLKYIREHPDLKSLPVIVFSNSYMTNLIERAWRTGADHCLMKASTTPNQLLDVVSKAIQRAAARGAAPARPAAVFVPPVDPLANRPGMTAPLPSGFSPAPPVAATPAPAAAPKPAGGTHVEADPEFQLQIRQLFLNRAPATLAEIRNLVVEFVKDDGSSTQMEQLNQLFRKVHTLTSNASVSGCDQIAQFASAFEALLKELQQKPKFINASTLRTVIGSADFFNALFARASQPQPAPPNAPAILVAESDPTSSQSIVLALEKAEMTPVTADNSTNALSLLTQKRFDLVVVAVEFAGMNGFEFCAKLRTLPAYAQTPVLFVAPLSEFQNHADAAVNAGNDIIAKPFLLVEMALKVLTHLLWIQLK